MERLGSSSWKGHSSSVCSVPSVAGRGRFSERPQKEKLLGPGAMSPPEGLHSLLPRKGLQPPSSFAPWFRKTTPTPLQWHSAQRVHGLWDVWLLSARGLLAGKQLGWLQTSSGSICFHTLSSTDGAAAGIPEFKLTPSCWMCLCKARAATARQNRARPPLLQCIKAGDVFMEVGKG